MAEATGTSERGLELCQDLRRRIGSPFTCSDHGDYQRIRTPYLYPDGDNIDLFCKVDGDTVTISDLAETTAGFACSRLACADRRSRTGSSKTPA